MRNHLVCRWGMGSDVSVTCFNSATAAIAVSFTSKFSIYFFLQVGYLSTISKFGCYVNNFVNVILSWRHLISKLFFHLSLRSQCCTKLPYVVLPENLSSSWGLGFGWHLCVPMWKTSSKPADWFVFNTLQCTTLLSSCQAFTTEAKLLPTYVVELMANSSSLQLSKMGVNHCYTCNSFTLTHFSSTPLKPFLFEFCMENSPPFHIFLCTYHSHLHTTCKIFCHLSCEAINQLLQGSSFWRAP